MNGNLKNTLRDYNLSERIIFDRQMVGQRKIQPECEYAVMLFVGIAKKHPFSEFVKAHRLKKGQKWATVYTYHLKKILLDKFFGDGLG